MIYHCDMIKDVAKSIKILKTIQGVPKSNLHCLIGGVSGNK